jgi:hypothetical protein
VLDDPFLHLLEVEVVLVKDFACALEIEVVLCGLVPGQRRDPVEVRTDDAVFRRRRRQLLEPGELPVDGLSDFLRQLELGEPFTQLVDLGLLGVAFAQLVLDRL